ncbi:MAG: hypothetical protein EBQ89_06710 [Alphaproteobacteria bacterium]|nr:hypothetical protein [Alphaproteobacteria bacterium]
MNRLFALLCVVLVLAGCADDTRVAQFWRPISHPNLNLPLDKSQLKLEYDLSQCNCGVFPRNVPLPLQAEFDPTMQRYIETSAVALGDGAGNCTRQPSLVVAECMRSRGWEMTQCSGRQPVAGGGAVCSLYVLD